MTYELAQHVLRRYWNGVLPVDPFYIAAQEGVVVRQESGLQEAVGGALSGAIGFENEIPTIIYNPFDHPNRIRFTIAHELGHYFHGHLNSSNGNVLFRDNANTLYGRGRSPLEIEANGFAAELLMPRDIVQSLFRWEVNTIEELAERFFVSTAAMSYRLTNIGLLPSYGSR